ncbi:acylphosphatase-2 isoform X3 [Odocoileus virginianus]|uniref:acylphosphatase n=1 Tax=Odocoileus virginianus TaxID=9874 RepID=A0ABM4J337_ODOVR
MEKPRVFVAAHGLPLGCGLLVAAAFTVEQGLSGCGAGAAQLLRSTWDLPGPETEPSAPALAGVCFRMYTEDEARKIGVVGWVKNTSKGTVTGQVQGPEEKVNSIGEKIQSWKVSCSRSHGKFRKSWLSKIGSPSSRIDRTNFSNEKTISKLEYSNFSIRY